MLRSRRAARAAVLAGSVVLAATMLAPPATAGRSPDHSGSGDPWKVIATGLDSPRHLAIHSGDLYVVEAGRGGDGPCVEHPPLGTFCLGATGAVTKVRVNGPDRRVVTGLPSIKAQALPGENEDDKDTLGASDIAFDGGRHFTLAIGLGGDDAFRDAFGPGGTLLATLVKGKLGKSGVTLFADVLANEVANNPEPEDIDSNPVGLLRRGSSYLVTDAGGNDLLKVSRKGDFSTVAVFPFGSALAPPFLGLPPGTEIPTDPVPTEVVLGPDGAYYVSQLTGFPFEKGGANIFRVVPGQQPTVYASGLTNLTDLAFARNGDLYAVQISTEGLLTGPIGSLVRVNPYSSTHEVIAGGLNAPYGVALDRRSAYVSTCTTCTGDGTVIKIPLPRKSDDRHGLADEVQE